MSTQNIHFHDKIKKKTLNTCPLELSEEFHRDSKNEFELAMVKEPLVFELLRCHCTMETTGTRYTRQISGQFRQARQHFPLLDCFSALLYPSERGHLKNETICFPWKQTLSF